jgi:hypothetical protein
MIRRLAFVSLALAFASIAFAKGDAVSLIPNDAVTVGVIHLADLRNSPLSSTLFQQTDHVSVDGDAERFLSEAGLQPMKDVDLLVIAASPRQNLGNEGEVLIAAEGRFNVDRLTKALVARGAVKKNGYLILPNSKNGQDDQEGAVAFPDSHLALIGSESAVAEALDSRAHGGTTFLSASGLGRDIARIDPHASAFAVFDVARAARLSHAPHVPSSNNNASQLASALKSMSTVAIWATDTGDSLKLGGFGIARDAETLQLVEDTLRGALAAMRLAVQDKSPELVGVLRKFDVSRTSDTVTISGTLPAQTIKDLVAKQRHVAEMR